MSTELSIKIDYLAERQSPNELFEALGIYISAYEEFAQLISNSIGNNQDFKFKLSELSIGSIRARLAAVSSYFDEIFMSTASDAGRELFKSLSETSETATEEDVDAIASRIQSEINGNGIVEPEIDRANLSRALNKFSKANSLMKPGEKVIIYEDNNSSDYTALNLDWRFTGDLNSMFKGTTQRLECHDILSVKIAVNEGKQLWTFISTSMNRTFTAKIVVPDWIEKYQSGLIPAIGPKDILKVKLTYDLFTPYRKNVSPAITNAKITSIDEIIRNKNDHQYELPS
ncbi:hypothetical protein AB4I13_10375 [Serratia marcescens]|uniref:hypothetical protein n=1 Tax=Serratia marcescens TaxID=615 RepID=UPI001038266D|nr:hypothetical protein [Serratia marcescens]TBU69676.1 hypothetical protein EG355_02960 [Serratia marcescens]